MIITLSDYIKSFSSASSKVQTEKLGALIADLSINPPTAQNTLASEHYFDGYKCSNNTMLEHRLKKSILDKLFNRNIKLAPLNAKAIQQCGGVENIKQMAKEQQKFFLMQHALLFAITKIGNCSERSAYSALVLFDLFKHTKIKVGLQSLKTKDQFCVCLGNNEQGWMVYDPITNPHILFDFSYYIKEITPYFETYPYPKIPFKMAITQGNVEQFSAQYEKAQCFIKETLCSTTSHKLMHDVSFACHIQQSGANFDMLDAAHEELCRLMRDDASLTTSSQQI